MKKLLLLILPILLFITTTNINVKADSDSDGWYIPDLQEYTFNIPSDSEDLIFISHDFVTGNFAGFISRFFDFGVSQNANGALDFSNIQSTLFEVNVQSFLGGKYGLTPMFNNLPSYITYNVYNTYDRSEYKGAVNIHVITYRLDFMGNYSMLLDENIYDIVYSLEIKYEELLDYFDDENGSISRSGYTIHWYDTTEMEEYKLYTTMYSNELQFQLKNIVDYDAAYDAGYEAGHQAGYNQGLLEGFEMTDKNILLITLIMYLLTIFVYFKFKLKWILIATILLWFVPLFLINNLFIRIFCIIMIIATITITFFSEREEEF